MNVRQLSQLYYLNMLIKRNERRLEEMRDRLTNISPKLSGMPGQPGASDAIGSTMPEIVDLIRQIEVEKAAYVEEKAKLESYLNCIEDAQVRLIFVLRFVDLKTWNEVADVLGGNNSADSVKKVCYRYLKREKEKSVPNVPHVPPEPGNMQE